MNFKKTAAVMIAGLLSAIMIAGCGRVNPSDTALTINGETINAGTASTFVRYQQAETYTMMQYYGLISEGAPYWDMDVPTAPETAADSSASSSSASSASSSSSDTASQAKTYGEAFLNDVRESIVTDVLIRQHAGEYGFALTDEQKQAITDAAAKFISDNATVAKWIGADQASVENMLSLIAHQLLMYDKIIEDTDREVSDEEAAQSTIIYARLPLTVPDDYEGTEEEYADEAKSDMEELLAKMKAGITADDVKADEAEAEGEDAEEAEEEPTESDLISDVATEINENFYVTTASFGEDNTTLDEKLKEAAKTLSDGEVYNTVIETDSYLYAVKMVEVFDKEATESHKSTIISERESQKYSDTIQAWKDEAQITEGKGWTDLKVTDKESYVAAQ